MRGYHRIESISISSADQKIEKARKSIYESESNQNRVRSNEREAPIREQFWEWINFKSKSDSTVSQICEETRNKGKSESSANQNFQNNNFVSKLTSWENQIREQNRAGQLEKYSRAN